MSAPISAVILAAGRGERMGQAVNKPYLLLHGRPILYYAFARFGASPLIDEIILVVRAGEIRQVRETVLEKCAFDKAIRVVVGGAERQDSAYNGVRAAGGDYVLVHDGVRPFFSDKLLERVIEATKAYGAALPVLPLSDTLFLISADGFIERAFDRRWIVHAQTPQGFERKLLCESLEKAQARGLRFTDEAGAVWAMSGVRAKWIEGEEWNIKITTPWDLQLAECIGRTLRV